MNPGPEPARYQGGKTDRQDNPHERIPSGRPLQSSPSLPGNRGLTPADTPQRPGGWGGALRVLRNLWLDAVGRRAGGVGVGGEAVAELAVVHHRSEDAGLVPGQPGQPVGELLVGEAAQPRLAGIVPVVGVPPRIRRLGSRRSSRRGAGMGCGLKDLSS